MNSHRSSNIRVKTEPAVGLLSPVSQHPHIQHLRFHPSPTLAKLIEHYWFVRWQLPIDQPATPPISQSILTHPSVQIVMESGYTKVYGVQTKLFTRQLRGASQVLGIKMRPGAFFALTGYALSQLTDRVIALEQLSLQHSAWLPTIRACARSLSETSANVSSLISFIDKLDQDLAQSRPHPDTALLDELGKMEQLIATVKQQPLYKVADVCQSIHLSKRQAQRLCAKLLGVTPKWLINRHRLQWLAGQIMQGYDDWPALIARCGYTDQSHFINDFKKHIGMTPIQFRKTISAQQDRHVAA